MANNAIANALNIRKIRNDDIVIAFMGPTGSGKSHFIDLLTGQVGRRAGKSLKSVTSKIQATRVKRNGYEDRIVLVDTPGFDDTTRSDMETLAMISKWLARTYNNDVKLSGLVYLHRITDNRMAGSPHKNLWMFGSLCGDDAAARVVLVSTMWQTLADPEFGQEREVQLRKQSWNSFIDQGSSVDRLNTNTSDEAWRIVDKLITRAEDREAAPLQEVVNTERELNETKAVKTIYRGPQKLLAEQKAALETLRTQAEKSNDLKLKKELEKEYKKIQTQFDKTSAEARSMKVSLWRRISLFFEKKFHVKTINFSKFNSWRVEG